MNEAKLFDTLDIRYANLLFTLQFIENTTLPIYKASALRGGMGQMLLSQNCIGDRVCENCGFEQECIVRRIMYAKYETQPWFGGDGESIGYIIECRNELTNFTQGDVLEFHLLLFGKTIALFSQCLQAFYMLGQRGLGKNHAKFRIVRVEDQERHSIVEDGCVFLQNLTVANVAAYTDERIQTIRNTAVQNTMVFITPASIKYGGKILNEFHSEALIRSLLRRVYSFDCFEGNGQSPLEWDAEMPQIISQKVQKVEVNRYSTHKNERIPLRGIIGTIQFDWLSDELLLLLAAGEILHIGKNTSFGFGSYLIS